MGVNRKAAFIVRYLMQARQENNVFSLEHVVFYVHHSQALSLLYGKDEQGIMDVLQYAPVLVYYNNPDGRQNGWLSSVIDGRQYGLAFVVEE